MIQKKKNISMKIKRKTNPGPYLFMIPTAAILIIFLIVPTVYAVVLGFTDASLLTINKAQFIGLDNFNTFIKSSSFSKVIFATLIYVIGGVSFTYLIGLFTALLLNQKFKGRAVARSLVIVPWAVPQVVLVLIWRWMFNPGFGVVNYLLNSIGILEIKFSWFSTIGFAMVGVLLATLWKQYPLGCLILLAGMQSIPHDLYEAASIDGASWFGKFRYITMPGLKYVTNILLLLLIIWHFTNFTIIWLLTMGGPADTTATFTIFTYLNAFKFNRLGYGAFLGTITFLIAFILSAFYYIFIIRRIDKE